MYDNTAGILNYRGSGVQNTCRIFSPYHSGVENPCRIFMQYPSVVQNTCRIVMLHLSAVGNTGLLFQLWRVPGCRGVTAYAPQTALRSRITVMLWDVLGDGGWNYGHVFATYGWRLWGVCNTPLPPGTCHTLKYRHVFHTEYMLYIKIRTPLPNPIRATHRKTRPIFQHLADGGNHDREVWPTFGAVHFKNNVLKTYL